MFFYFTVTRDGLADFGAWILKPIVFAAVANEDTTLLLDLSHEVDPLHATVSSARLRTFGIAPVETSA